MFLKEYIHFLIDAIFFRAAQKLNFSTKTQSLRVSKKKPESLTERKIFSTNFSGLLQRNPPQPPSNLFSHGSFRRGDGHGKVSLHYY